MLGAARALLGPTAPAPMADDGEGGPAPAANASAPGAGAGVEASACCWARNLAVLRPTTCWL
eukprot:8107787-Lingulodinium_polyedra.AAC.1